MYHPTRPGVRGGRDQFKWDDVKVDKHRENYIGHSLKAPVGRWQKGKDLFWYTKDKNAQGAAEQDAMKAEIQRVKEEEEQMMREALGLAPKRATRPKGNRIDKHEFSELVKRGSTAEDVGAGHAEAAAVTGVGFARAPRTWEVPSTLPPAPLDVPAAPVYNKDVAEPSSKNNNNRKDDSDDENDRRKRRREEKKRDRHDKHEHSREEKKRDRHEKRHSRDSYDMRKHKKDKERRRHDSD